MQGIRKKIVHSDVFAGRPKSSTRSSPFLKYALATTLFFLPMGKVSKLATAYGDTERAHTKVVFEAGKPAFIPPKEMQLKRQPKAAFRLFDSEKAGTGNGNDPVQRIEPRRLPRRYAERGYASRSEIVSEDLPFFGQLPEIRGHPTAKPKLLNTGVVLLNVPLGAEFLRDMYENKFGGGEFGPEKDFRFTSNPFNHALGLNYLGCFDYPYVITRLGTKAYEWAGFSKLDASLLSGLNTGLLVAYAKYQEGRYGKGANAYEIPPVLGGIMFGILKENSLLNDFNFRWCLIPDYTQWNVGPKPILLDYYANQLFAITYNIGSKISNSRWIVPLDIMVTTQINHDSDGLRTGVGFYWDVGRYLKDNKIVSQEIAELFDYLVVPIFPIFYMHGGKLMVTVPLFRGEITILK